MISCNEIRVIAHVIIDHIIVLVHDECTFYIWKHVTSTRKWCDVVLRRTCCLTEAREWMRIVKDCDVTLKFRCIENTCLLINESHIYCRYFIFIYFIILSLFFNIQFLLLKTRIEFRTRRERISTFSACSKLYSNGFNWFVASDFILFLCLFC